MADAEVLDPEVVGSPSTTLALRHPGVPTTINDLAALKGEAVAIIEAREQVLATLRKAAIRATSPEDWLLFKSPDGRVTAYLQDCGADRVRDLYGIEIFGVERPEKVNGSTPDEFHYLLRGSGRCKITGQVLLDVEGGRSSKDDFCRGKTGTDLELAVRKAARANLDGNLTRELAGLKSLPVDVIAEVWTGTNKRVEHCRQGRGFGTKAQRAGADVREAGQPQVDAPFCDICGSKAQFVKAGVTKEGREYEAFWTCPRRDNHKEQQWTVKAAKWEEDLKARASKPAATEQPRDPGQEG